MRSMNGRHVPWLVITSFITGLPAVSPLVTMWSLQEESIPWQQYQDTMMTALWMTCPDWTREDPVMAVHHFCLRASRWDWQHDVTHNTNDPIIRCWWSRVDILVSTVLTPLSSSDQALTGRRSPLPGCPGQWMVSGWIMWTTESSCLVSET